MSDPGANHDLAFSFAPPTRPQAFGSPRLEIHLRAHPTGKHFDPEHVLVPVYSAEAGMQTLKFSHPWHSSNAYDVFPGRIVLHDRLGEVEEAYSFGGTLEVGDHSDLTTLTIRSNAPILYLIGEQTPAELLAEEIEILLAETRARWGLKREEFLQKLAVLDPNTLYQACLLSLKQKLRTALAQEGGPMHRLALLVQAELRTFTADPAAPPKTLSELL